MASLFEGFEYDIFISYRQKDNKGSRWVSEFVEALKVELEATFKEDISIYFDENPHDGLLETHDVDASLSEKLKCLIFIPVISRTYCDPKSFAWEHEFRAFIEQAGQDRIGLKIKLPNGNVSTRVLPVRIHELDIEDTKLCESVLGSVLRGVDFIYKSPGVNRPLMANEEHPRDNLNKTYYRDQINKVANAIDEIIHSLKSGRSSMDHNSSKVPKETISKKSISKWNIFSQFYDRLTKRGLILFISLLLCLSGAFVVYKYLIKTHARKTVAVIPYTYPRDDLKLTEYAYSATDEIIGKLQKIKSLSVRHQFSSRQYLNSEKTVDQLRNELKVKYLVEVTIRKIGDFPKIGISLKEAKGNRQIWVDQYDIDEGNLMPLFTEITQAIARNLNVKFTTEEILNIEKDMSKNKVAVRNYLTGNARLFTGMGNKFIDSLSFVDAIEMYDKAIEADPDFAIAYSRRAIARSWGVQTRQLNSTHIEKCLSDIQNALRIDKELTDAQIALGFYYYYCKREYTKALISFNTASLKDPENYQPLFYMALVYRKMGEWEMSQSYIKKVLEFNPQEPLFLTNIGLSYTYLHNYDSALIYHQKAIDASPRWSASYLNKIETLLLKYGNTIEARGVLDSLTRYIPEKQVEVKIFLDIFDGNYTDAFAESDKAGPEDFNIKGNKFLYQANVSSLLHNQLNAVNYYNAALSLLQIDIASDSTNAKILGLTGIAYAGLGRRSEALSVGKKALERAILNKDRMEESDMILNLAKINSMLGINKDALSGIEYALTNPCLLSVEMFKIDPVWKPLLNLTEFKAILEKYSKK